MTSLAIIPARGGSKRIPRKNILNFLGKPIIAYPIFAALRSNLFDEVMVSTDDTEISAIAASLGAQVPFLRSTDTAHDKAVLCEVVMEVLAAYKARGQEFQSVCCILPTAPFVTAEDLQHCHSLLCDRAVDAVVPIVRFSFPIQRAFRCRNGLVSMVWPENMHVHSQDLEPTYHDAGLFYWIKTDSLLKQKKLFADRTAGYEIAEARAQDIDTQADWDLAELKYQILNSSTKRNDFQEER